MITQMPKRKCDKKVRNRAERTNLSSRNFISQPFSSLMVFPGRAATSLEMICIVVSSPINLFNSALINGVMPPERMTIGTLFSFAQS